MMHNYLLNGKTIMIPTVKSLEKTIANHQSDILCYFSKDELMFLNQEIKKQSYSVNASWLYSRLVSIKFYKAMVDKFDLPSLEYTKEEMQELYRALGFNHDQKWQLELLKKAPHVSDFTSYKGLFYSGIPLSKEQYMSFSLHVATPPQYPSLLEDALYEYFCRTYPMAQMFWYQETNNGSDAKIYFK